MIRHLHQSVAQLCCAILKFLVIVIVIVNAVSCSRRPLEEEAPTGSYADILLMTDWKLLPETPTGISAIFYPDDGSTPVRIMANNIKQNVVRLRRGTYHVIVFNQSEY